MSDDAVAGDALPGGSTNPRRRPRYAGTHPRRFDQRYKELRPASFPGIHEHVRAQGRTPAGTHVPVMVEEVLAALRPDRGEVVVDCTLGYGGHAIEFLRRIATGGRLIGLDVDAAAIERNAARLGGEGPHSEPRTDAPGAASFRPHRCHFAGIGKVLAREGLEGCDILFADLGPSSMQLDDPARGFSYKHDGPLDMRMDGRLKRTAAEFLATLSAGEIADCLREFSDEPHHERIARAIVERRAVEPITRTRQLVKLIDSVTRPSGRAAGRRPSGSGHDLHPAARTFQALRMLVNDEMAAVEQLLRVAPWCLRPGGRIGIVSFHSGEHRRVQEAFVEGHRCGLYSAISPEALVPTPQELRSNPRSRSAQLRWAQRSAS